MADTRPLFRQFILHSTTLYNLRIFIALSGAVYWPWWSGQLLNTIPLTLGVVAAALTDLDDDLPGRLRNLAITLLSFTLAILSTVWLFPWPWLFLAGLTLSTWGFILLGALGPRYATIAFGALLIAIYTMLGMQLFTHPFLQAELLLAGTVWYNLIALLGHLCFPVRPLQDRLYSNYQKLAGYLEQKAWLFDPDLQDEQQALLQLGMANSELIADLELTKAALFSRVNRVRGQRNIGRALQDYFIIQDIHERASSAHIAYQALRQTFRHSDVLFRFQRIVALQSRACYQLAHALITGQGYRHNTQFMTLFRRLDETLHQLRQRPSAVPHLPALRGLLQNLMAIDAQLAAMETEQWQSTVQQTRRRHLLSAYGSERTGWQGLLRQLHQHLTPASPLFRHAVRMSLVLGTGYLIIQLANLPQGYWILLTSLFVCQPNYTATRHRLRLRIIGTIAGVLSGMPLLWLVPSVEGQLLLIVLSGTLFFALRLRQYAYATLFITLLVLLCFNLQGKGFAVIAPRIIDTLIGCLLAWLAVSFIWPDWKFFNLAAVTKNSLAANCRYLKQILLHYQRGLDQHPHYLAARHEAQSADAALISLIASAAGDPHLTPEQRERGFRLLCLNQTLSGYITALGIHREKLHNPQALQLLDETITFFLHTVAAPHADTDRLSFRTQQLTHRLQQALPQASPKEALVLQQAGLLLTLLPDILELKVRLADDAAMKTGGSDG